MKKKRNQIKTQLIKTYAIDGCNHKVKMGVARTLWCQNGAKKVWETAVSIILPKDGASSNRCNQSRFLALHVLQMVKLYIHHTVVPQCDLGVCLHGSVAERTERLFFFIGKTIRLNLQREASHHPRYSFALIPRSHQQSSPPTHLHGCTLGYRYYPSELLRVCVSVCLCVTPAVIPLSLNRKEEVPSKDFHISSSS